MDNQGSYTKGKASEKGEVPYRHLGEDYDYKIIRKELEEELEVYHNIHIKYKWVRGHQDSKPMKDKKNKDIPLSPQAILDIHCDKRADQYWKHPSGNRIPSQNPPIPTEVQAYYKSKDQVNVSRITQ